MEAARVIPEIPKNAFALPVGAPSNFFRELTKIRGWIQKAPVLTAFRHFLPLGLHRSPNGSYALPPVLLGLFRDTPILGI